MFPHYPLLSKGLVTLALITFCVAGAATCPAATVTISPQMDIASVVAANPAGTTFVIEPGLYRLEVPIKAKDGDTFIGQKACAPPKTACPAVLNGSVELTSFQAAGRLHYVSGQTQRGKVTITTVQCQPMLPGYPKAYPGCMYPEDLYFDNKPLVHVTTLAEVGPGTWFFDYPNATIYFYDDPTGHKVETSVVPSAFVWGSASNVTVENLTIEKFAVPIQGGALAAALPSQTAGANWVVQHNEIRLNHGAGVAINFGWQILNNYIHHNGQLGIAGGTGSSTKPSGVLVEGNELAYNNYAHVSPRFGAGGSKTGKALGLVFRGNYSHDNEGSGFHNDVGAQNAVYDNNIAADNTEMGIFFEIGYGALVRNNTLLRNGYIHPNWSYWLYGANLLSSSSQNVIAYCNTAEISAKGGNGLDIIAQPREVSSGNHFHHNTVVFDGSSGVNGAGSSDPTQTQFFTLNHLDNNSYHLPALSRYAFPWKAGRVYTFPKLQAAGGELNSSADTLYTQHVPTVTVTSPADGSTVGSSITIKGTAHDSVPLSKVELYLDWSLSSTAAGSSPFTFTAPGVSQGRHTLAAMAYSADGVRACYAVSVTVK